MFKNKKAFTLIELIVVMAIIGVLVLLAMPKFMGYTERARLTEIKSNIKQIENASERFYIDFEDWPRVGNVPYTADEIDSFANEVMNKTGTIVKLEENGKYYPINYDKLQKYVQEPKDGVHYILQNPIGEVFYLKDLTEKGRDVFYKKNIEEDNNEEGQPSINQLDELKLGDYVQYGVFNGYSLIWNVVKKENDNVLLFSTSALKDTDGRYLKKIFDESPNAEELDDGKRAIYGSNNWYYSDIRIWLNDDFYNTAFENKEIIKETTHDYILPEIDKAKKTSGTTRHEYNADVNSALKNYNTTAYKNTTTDKVYLISIKELVENINPIIGTNYYGAYGYWTRDSYAAYSNNVRIVYANGNITYTQPLNSSMTIRPALNINSATIISGDGTKNNPYIIK